MISVGSYTVIDFNDGISIIANIRSNHPYVLAYDPATGTYTPSWQSIPLVLTPVANVGGRPEDIISTSINKKWYYRRSGDVLWTQITNGVNDFTINASDELGYTGHDLFDGSHTTLEFKFEFTYYDTTLKINLQREITIGFARVSNGTSVVIAYANSTGDRFKNGMEPSYIDLSASLMRGTSFDNTAISYQWQKLIGDVWTDISGATISTYRVLPSTVDGSSQFRCKIIDNDISSDTYNEIFLTNGLTILDFTDPYTVEIIPISGSGIIKNGSGSVELKANVYQNGVEVDADGSAFSYRWYKVGDGTTLASTKSYTVQSTQVDGSNSFNCEVSK